MTLKHHREYILRMPQMTLAARVPCHQAWISHVEQGKARLRPWNRQKLADAYGVTLEQFEEMLGETIRENQKRRVPDAPRVPRGSVGDAADRRGAGRKVPSGVGQPRRKRTPSAPLEVGQPAESLPAGTR